MVIPIPATVIVATRPVVAAFAATLSITVPFPGPVPPDWIEIHGEWLSACQEHLDDAFTTSCSVATPEVGSSILFGVTENPQTCFVSLANSQYVVGVGWVGPAFAKMSILPSSLRSPAAIVVRPVAVAVKSCSSKTPLPVFLKNAKALFNGTTTSGLPFPSKSVITGRPYAAVGKA